MLALVRLLGKSKPRLMVTDLDSEWRDRAGMKRPGPEASIAD